jgi:hypothetical protein
MVINSIN